MKDYVCFAIGAIGSMIASLFGGWDASLQTLVIFMAIDYITGLTRGGRFPRKPQDRDRHTGKPRRLEGARSARERPC